MKRFIALLVALSCVILCFVSCGPKDKPNDDPVGVALEAEGVPFKFYLVAGEDGVAAEATVYMWTEVTNSITIPETVEYNGHTYPITRVGLGQGITADPNEVTKVIISKNVKVISKNAFTMCVNLLSVSLPEGLETIEGSAFSMTGLTTVVLPSTVKTVEKSAFYSCISLQAVSINPEIETIGDMAFGVCLSLEEVQLPNRFKDRMGTIFINCDTVINKTCRIIYTE